MRLNNGSVGASARRMMGRRTLLALGAALAVLVSGCGVVKSYSPFRYRLTVEVETPQGMRSGSSVVQVSAGEVRSTLGGQAMELDKGEAVAVDLPGGETLFALLRSEDDGEWAAHAMARVTSVPNEDAVPINQRFAAHVEAIRASRDLITLPRYFEKYSSADKQGPSGYPQLVRFRDIADPKSVERVDPDNLAASFGAGFKLRRMTVQVTDDPVTTGIWKRLGWLDKLVQFRTDPSNPFTNTLPKEIGGLRSN